MSKVTLRKGDYVSTEGMTEDLYHAVAKAFMEAGADGAHFSRFMAGVVVNAWRYIGAPTYGDFRITGNNNPHGGRHLTIEQVLGANDPRDEPIEYTPDPISLLKAARQARDEAEAAYQDAMAAVRASLGDGFTLDDNGAQACAIRDLPPEEWKEGDLVECVTDAHNYVKSGGIYKVSMPLYGNDIRVIDKDGDEVYYPVGSFRFHRRPTA